jgi:hypothetical protein
LKRRAAAECAAINLRHYAADKDLPDTGRLQDLGLCAAQFIRAGNRVLCQCGMRHNRSALVAGVILTHLGRQGSDAGALVRSKRQGALYNRSFANYLMGSAQRRMAETQPRSSLTNSPSSFRLRSEIAQWAMPACVKETMLKP